jgi:hypothetical protein
VSETVIATLDHRSDEQSILLASQALSPGGFQLGAGEMRRLPLCLEMPWGTPFDGSVQLVVTVRYGVWSQSVRATIQVAPPSKFVSHVEQLGHCAKLAVRRWEYGPEGALVAEMMPTVQPSSFRRARLSLHRVDDDWYGELTLHLNSRSVWAPQARTIAVPFLPCDPDKVRETFHSLLRDAGFDTGRDPTLPLPAGPVEPFADNLPTPSEARVQVLGVLPRPPGETGE